MFGKLPSASGIGVLLTFGVFSILLSLRIIAFPVPWIATLMAVLAVWAFPGLLLWYLIDGEQSLFSWDALPICLILGIDALTLIGGLAVIVKSSLDDLIYVFVAVVVILVAGYIWFNRKGYLNRTRSSSNIDEGSKNPSLYIASVISVVILLLVFAASARIRLYGDIWTYLGLIRNHLDTSHLGTHAPFFEGVSIGWREGFDAFGIQIAALSKIAQVEPAELFCLYLPPVLIIASSLAYIGLAKELFRDCNTALFAFLIQVVYYLSDMKTHEGVGFQYLGRIVEDKFAVRFFIFPMTLLLMLRYFSSGKKSHLLAFSLTMVSASLIHPIGFVLCASACGAFALAHLLFSLRRKEWTKFTLIFVPIVLSMLIPLVQRQYVPNRTFNSAVYLEIQLQLHSNRLLIFDLGRDRYMAHPHLIEHPIVILAILLTPLLLQDIRKSTAAQFLFSNTVAVLVLFYNPITAPLVGKLVTPWWIWRLVWLLPTSLTAGFLAYRGISKAQKWLAEAFSLSPQGNLFKLAPVLVVVLAIGLLGGHITSGWNYLKGWSYTQSVPEEERTLMTYMREHVMPDSTVLVWPPISTHIPGLVGKGVSGITFRIYPSLPSAFEDTEQFYNTDFVDDSTLGILEKYEVGYVVLETDSLLAFQFNLLPSMFSRIYGNDEFELFKVVSELQPDHVVSGNTYLAGGEWDKATAEYKEALKFNSSDALAHFGLAQAYQAKDEMEQAIAEYEKAVAASPDEVWLHLYLAEAYVAKGRTAEERGAHDKAVETYRQAFALTPDNPEIRDALVKAYLTLGERYFEQNLLFEVIAAYEKDIELEPGNLQAYWKLAEVYKTLDQMDEAIAVYTRVVERWPEGADAHFYLGQAYEAQGEIEEAMAAYETAIELKSTWAGAYTRLGNIYEAQGETKDVIALYRAAAKKNPAAAWPHIQLGKVYLEQAR